MGENIQKVRKIVAKAFRKAKRWYLGYVCCQILVLAFAVTSIFSEININLSALLTFLGVFVIEFIRWRSDWWKSEGEKAKRKYEAADGLGVELDGSEVANWLAARSRNILADVSDDEVKGSLFDSGEPVGPRRAVENTQESAWWSSHLSRRMVIYIIIFLLLALAISFGGMAVGISMLKSSKTEQSGALVQNLGGIICAVLVFIFSINLVRLLADFCAFWFDSNKILNHCAELLKSNNISFQEAIHLMNDYQTTRNAAPLLPTFVWKLHGRHLREQWEHFKPKKQ